MRSCGRRRALAPDLEGAVIAAIASVAEVGALLLSMRLQQQNLHKAAASIDRHNRFGGGGEGEGRGGGGGGCGGRPSCDPAAPSAAAAVFIGPANVVEATARYAAAGDGGRRTTPFADQLLDNRLKIYLRRSGRTAVAR